MCAYAIQPKILKWLTVSLCSAQASSGVMFLTVRVGHLFRTWTLQLTVSGQNFSECFLCQYTSHHVQNCAILSLYHTILLWWVGCCQLSPDSMHCTEICKFSGIEFTPRSVRRILISLPDSFSTLALKLLNTEKLQIFPARNRPMFSDSNHQ